MTNHIPLVLKYEAWPEADCAAWDSLFIVGDLFDDVGPCQDWSEGSRAIRRQSYGQWLSFICRTDSLALGVAPCERITLERVKAFVGECRERLAPHTVKTHVVNLYVLAKAMAPEMDWAWLNTAAKRLTNKANKRCLPPPHPIDAREIFQWSLSYMIDTAADDGLSAKKTGYPLPASADDRLFNGVASPSPDIAGDAGGSPCTPNNRRVYRRL